MIEHVEQFETMCDTLKPPQPGLLNQLDAWNAEARQLLSRLMDAPKEQRRALITRNEFRTLRLVDLLLEESHDLLPAQPRQSEELADLAFQIASQRHKPALSRRHDDARAQACVLTGAARRLTGNVQGAEKSFSRAAIYLTGPPESFERALYCQHLAALRLDQERDDVATSLLWRAALIFNESADVLEEAACLAELGLLFVAGDQVDRAILPLTRAGEALDLHPDPSLTVLARLGLAVCHARLGEAEKAQHLVKTARRLVGRISKTPRQSAQIAWMEGKVAALTGNLDDAPGLLDTAFKAFIRQERLMDAAFAGLDLAGALARQGRLDSLRPVIDAIVEGFRTDIRQIGVLRVLGIVESALVRGRRAELGSVIASATATLRQYRRNPLLVFDALKRD